MAINHKEFLTAIENKLNVTPTLLHKQRLVNDAMRSIDMLVSIRLLPMYGVEILKDRLQRIYDGL